MFPPVAHNKSAQEHISFIMSEASQLVIPLPLFNPELFKTNPPCRNHRFEPKAFVPETFQHQFISGIVLLFNNSLELIINLVSPFHCSSTLDSLPRPLEGIENPPSPAHDWTADKTR